MLFRSSQLIRLKYHRAESTDWLDKVLLEVILSIYYPDIVYSDVTDIHFSPECQTLSEAGNTGARDKYSPEWTHPHRIFNGTTFAPTSDKARADDRLRKDVILWLCDNVKRKLSDRLKHELCNNLSKHSLPASTPRGNAASISGSRWRRTGTTLHFLQAVLRRSATQHWRYSHAERDSQCTPSPTNDYHNATQTINCFDVNTRNFGSPPGVPQGFTRKGLSL